MYTIEEVVEIIKQGSDYGDNTVIISDEPELASEVGYYVLSAMIQQGQKPYYRDIITDNSKKFELQEDLIDKLQYHSGPVLFNLGINPDSIEGNLAIIKHKVLKEIQSKWFDKGKLRFTFEDISNQQLNVFYVHEPERFKYRVVKINVSLADTLLNLVDSITYDLLDNKDVVVALEDGVDADGLYLEVYNQVTELNNKEFNHINPYKEEMGGVKIDPRLPTLREVSIDHIDEYEADKVYTVKINKDWSYSFHEKVRDIDDRITEARLDKIMNKPNKTIIVFSDTEAVAQIGADWLMEQFPKYELAEADEDLTNESIHEYLTDLANNPNKIMVTTLKRGTDNRVFNKAFEEYFDTGVDVLTVQPDLTAVRIEMINGKLEITSICHYDDLTQ